MNEEDTKISDLFPELSEQELKIAKANLDKYLHLVKKIFDDLSDEEQRKLALRLEWEKRQNSASQN